MAKIDLNNLSERDSNLISRLMQLMSTFGITSCNITFVLDGDVNSISLASPFSGLEEREFTQKVNEVVQQTINDYSSSKLN